MSYVVAAYVISALLVVLYEVKLRTEVRRRATQEEGRREGQDSSGG